MAAKRARVAFSSDTILDEIREVKELLDSVKMFTSQLSLSKIAEAIKMKEGKVDFDPAGLLALMFGYETITWILAAIHHVPKAFERRKNIRSTTIFELVNLLCPEKQFTPPLVDEIVSFVVDFIPHSSTLLLPETRCGKFEEALRQLTKKGGLQYGAFIAPPVTDCLSCGSLLSAPNPPTTTLPLLKISSITLTLLLYYSTTLPLLKISSITLTLLRYYSTTLPLLKISSITLTLLLHYSTTLPLLKISSIILTLLRYYSTTLPLLKISSITLTLLRYYSTTLLF